MPRENIKCNKHEIESTDAGVRGGSARSSDEAVEIQQSEGAELSGKNLRSTLQNAKEESRMVAKPFTISKAAVYEAYRKIRSNGGTYGIDRESLNNFDENLSDNLYKIWNRMSSGSYMPPAVRRVEIPKKGGGVRPLGIPTVSDRIAQMVAKMCLEPQCEVMFHEDSYAYRPNRSAHDALSKTKERCLKYSWVIDLDIKSFFDTIPHDLLMKAVRQRTEEPWLLLYIERWLKAPVQMLDGKMEERVRGTPQGAVISPLLANLFLHYTFDEWMNRNITNCPFERYADDAIVHCSSLVQAQYIKGRIENRFKECGLELHPAKTIIVYCVNGKDNGTGTSHEVNKFDFLGFTFKTRRMRYFRKQVNGYQCFSPAISTKSKVAIMEKVRNLRLRDQVGLDLKGIARLMNPQLRGWVNYYGKFGRSELYRVFQLINGHILRWMMTKYRISSRKAAIGWLEKVTTKAPHLFAHWELLNCKTVRQ